MGSAAEEHSQRVPGMDACVQGQLVWEGDVLPARPTGGVLKESVRACRQKV